jgi:hypothetical protein
VYYEKYGEVKSNNLTHLKLSGGSSLKLHLLAGDTDLVQIEGLGAFVNTRRRMPINKAYNLDDLRRVHDIASLDTKAQRTDTTILVRECQTDLKIIYYIKLHVP